MSRVTTALVVGCLSTLLLTFIGLSAAYVAMGTEAAFQAESFKPSELWIWVMCAVGFASAALGAVVAGVVAPRTNAALMLADVVLVLGLVVAVPVLIGSAADRAPRAGDLSFIEGIVQAQLPAWLALTYPIVAKVGVYLGAFAIRYQQQSTPVVRTDLHTAVDAAGPVSESKS